MRVSMAAIIHRAGRKFNVDAADGVSRRDTRGLRGLHPKWRVSSRSVTF